MKRKLFFLLFLALITSVSYSQKSDWSTSSIPDSLKLNANAVVRLDQTDITISSQRNMNIKQKRIVTVLNEKGLSDIRAFEYYSKSINVKNIEATVFNWFGNEIKKIKKKDFKDLSASGGAEFSESRIIYLQYTPIDYPFTVLYESEIETSNTAFIPQWSPLDDYFISVEKSVLNVKYPSNLGFKKKELNFANYHINKTMDSSTQLSYTATNLTAQKTEDYTPTSNLFPKLMMGLENFHLEGVDGQAKTWKEFGQWYSDKILSGTTELSDATKSKIKALVGNEQNPIEKAKIIYNYVQQKTRYVSIQIGIGGWKPMFADDVDRLGYGDCKALTNYTKALLNVVDVPSYNTVLYGDSYKEDIDADFVSMQGNHMILCVPNQENYIWLECTSQEDPFGYQGTFTDDRNVLIMKPDGGEIVRTKIYSDKENYQISRGTYSVSESGEFSGIVFIASEGSQYSRKFNLEKKASDIIDSYYKEYWDNISNLKLKKTAFTNDKEKVSFTEKVEVSAVNYGVLSGGKMMFVVNAFNKYTGSVKRIRNRKNAFEIQRGYYDVDDVEVNLPIGYSIEFLPATFELNSKFGEYKTEFIKLDNGKINYKRNMFLKKGLYSSKEYEEYRLFMEQISRNDNAKIILNKN